MFAMKNTLTALTVVLMFLSFGCSGGDQPTAPAGQAAGQPATTPIAHPASPQTAPSAAAAGGTRASFNGLSFEVPASWASEAPSSSMRLAQYSVPGPEGQAPAECALFHFPGQGGSVQANLDRWYDQFSQPDGGSTAEKAQVENFEAGGHPVTFVRATGTYMASMGPMAGGGEPLTGYALGAGVIETEQGPWFLKCTGPEATIDAAAPDIRALLDTVQ